MSKGLALGIEHVCMDHTSLTGSSSTIDLESGGTSSEDDEVKSSDSEGKKGKKKVGRLRSGSMSFTGFMRTGDRFISSSEDGSCDENLAISLREEARTSNTDKSRMVKEKKIKRSYKKHPKPPRPPGSLSLDAADMKLVREISELAKLKRARIERIKALKNKRSNHNKALTSSHGSSIFAMVVTILFFFVIIFQGFLGSRV